MSPALGTYTFLPWLRAGLANQITAADLDPAVALRATMPVALTLLGDGTRAEPVGRSVALFGPGDVVGIDPRAVVRTEPRNWTTNFEPNYLAQIEFYDEDFPWRYTPAAPDPVTGRLRPWIALVVLTEDEFTDGRDLRDRPLPYVELPDLDVLPPAEQLWAWAHVHVNRSLGATDAEVTSADMTKVIPRLQAVLSENPDLAYSRLLCPRKLAENTAYHAFVVPVFESGRLAGLGRQDPADAPSATASAWAPYPTGIRPEGGSFPYYHRWFFRTGSAGDFESLVRLLKPRPVDKRVGTRAMDVQDPGQNLPGIDGDLGGILKLGGALRVPRWSFTPEELAEVDRFEQWAQPYPTPFQTALATLVNRADDYAHAGTGGGDPVITPPLYGTWHALTRRLLRDREGDPVTPDDTWVHELNLDPRWRVAAGFGTRVVQERQEELMDAAWAQIGRVLEANRRIRLGQLAKRVSAVWHQRHLAQLSTDARETAFFVLAPVAARVLAGGATVRHQLRGARVQPALLSAPARRALRPRGRLVRGTGPRPPRPRTAALLQAVNVGKASASPPKQTPPGVTTVDELVKALPDPPPGLDEDGQTPRSVDELPGNPGFELVREPRRDAPTSRPGGEDNAVARRLKDALRDVYELTEASVKVGTAAEPAEVDVAALRTDLLAALDPERTIPRRTLAGIDLPPRVAAEIGEAFVEAMAYPEIDVPMYEPLKDLSDELFLPNINLVEPDSITLLETNQPFIESYMVGLNHEFARELLWREYPTDQRGSSFRQFWDVSGVLDTEGLAPEVLREQLRDIPPLHRWPPASKLGQHDHREEPGEEEQELVLVIRGELLKRYPTAVIYAHRACWQRKGPDGDVHPCLRTGAIDTTVERRLEPLTAAEELKPPRTKVQMPLYGAKVDPDISFFGFDLTIEQAVGDSGEQPDDDPGWFFVIKERPGEPRFGLDVDAQPERNVWGDLSWADLQPGPPGTYLQMTATAPSVTLVAPTAPEVQEKLEQYEDDRHVALTPAAGSAELAYVLFQAPVLVAVHAAEMLPRRPGGLSMARFEELRRALREAHEAELVADDAVVAARQRARAAATRLEEAARVLAPGDPERDRLKAELGEAERRLAEAREEQVAARNAVVAAVKVLGPLTDPRRSIGRLDDGLPILLLPVRLETRFQPEQSRLLVRIYPDDCSIDAFEPLLSETEVAAARRYWTAMWEAGGIEAQQRAAWRGLVAGHGSGRAEWIVRTYRPVNEAEAPVKALATDVVLTVATDEPLPAAEATAAAAYWSAVWLAAGGAAAVQEADDALDAAVGAARAAVIRERYRPDNLAAVPAPVNVRTAFVVFPPAEAIATKTHSWSKAPRATLLPDRFVFLGYHSGESTVVVVGDPVAPSLIVGPDPSAPEGEQLHQADGALEVPEAMRWMVDFESAVTEGMGIIVDLDDAHAAGFDRVVVVGVRLDADPLETKADVERLLEHHRHGRKGLGVLAQGVPTNNTEAAPAGFRRGDDPDESFDRLRDGAQFTDTATAAGKRDGQWLTEYLGLDRDALRTVPGAGLADQSDARAMNAALWPATLGYWMETLMDPVFSPGTIDRTRDFFVNYVSGRGAIPAVRIGAQPYGILPATAFTRLGAWVRRGRDPYLMELYRVLRAVEPDWAALAAEVPFAGGPGDPHRTLLEVLGLHPGSVEYHQRYAQGRAELFNRLNLQGLGFLLFAGPPDAKRDATRALLARLGHSGEDPEILERVFHRRHGHLHGPVIDDRPLSETEGVRLWTKDGRDYLRWLIDAASTSLDALYRQDGFLEDRPPTALLYLLLRHALQLGYHDVSVRLHEDAGLLDATAARAARRDEPFLHVDAGQESESRYALLYGTMPSITGSDRATMGDFIGAEHRHLAVASRLREQLEALERLEGASTARLERAFAEHVDLCSYRVDAWRLGLVHHQLAQMRGLDGGGPPRQGLHVGAYAWLEHVWVQPRERTPVALEGELEEVFRPAEEPVLERDATNQGYIHAPSLNQAVAAAVLRNGYISDAGPENPSALAVNLTSERVRAALGILEGIREGQSLGALLGYQFERGLHDRHAIAEVDGFIFELRRAFPLTANHLQSTSTAGEDPPVPIEAVEARNVLDGLALAEHAATGDHHYPFSRDDLPPASQAQAQAIDAEVERLLDVHDAVADLALAEGVQQAVLGNFDRVASTYDTYSKGTFPPEPQIVGTPSEGIGLTQRVALHLDAAADPAVSPVAGVAMTPRAAAEPALNAWLAQVLPAPGDIGCTAVLGTQELEVTLADLALQPIDLLYLLRDDAEQAMGELDDRIVRHVVTTHAPRPDTPVTIRYLDAPSAPYAVFEVQALVRQLRTLCTRSRPLRPSDLALTGEATTAQDEPVAADRARVVSVLGAMAGVRDDLAAFRTALEGVLGGPDPGAVIDGVDDMIDALAALLDRAARFGVLQAGWGFAYDFRRQAFAALLERAAALVVRWDARLQAFDDAMAAFTALGPAAPAAERFAALQSAERQVTTAPTAPLPDTPEELEPLVVAARAALQTRRDGFAALAATPRTRLHELLADVGVLLPVEGLDPLGFPIVEDLAGVVTFAQDALAVTAVVAAELQRRLDTAQTRLDEHDAAAAPADRVAAVEAGLKALLGDDFVVVPAFALPADRADELQQALAASTSGELFDGLEDRDLPVDTWLYGVARVRDKLRAFEQVTMLAGALGRPEPELVALQLPHRPGERWAGLQLHAGTTLDGDRLLYTTHLAVPFDRSAPQCGLLLDEWTEVIPAADTTTGITFHFDRPNTEAPQTMLLVTPADITGAWRFEDLVDALHDTLDLARRRAVEPAQLGATAYGPLLPATVMAVTARQLTISADLAINSGLQAVLEP